METPVVKNVLERVFDATYSLYFRTHSAHWNVRSPDFHSLHEMLGKQYEELWGALDEIAERLRACDLPAPAGIASVEAMPFGTPRNDVLSDLLRHHESVIGILRKGISELSEAGDEAGADFLTGRLAEHEKTAWMLRSSIG